MVLNSSTSFLAWRAFAASLSLCVCVLRVHSVCLVIFPIYLLFRYFREEFVIFSSLCYAWLCFVVTLFIFFSRLLPFLCCCCRWCYFQTILFIFYVSAYTQTLSLPFVFCAPETHREFLVLLPMLFYFSQRFSVMRKFVWVSFRIRASKLLLSASYCSVCSFLLICQ